MRLIFKKPKGWLMSDSKIIRIMDECHHIVTKGYKEYNGYIEFYPLIPEQAEDQYNLVHFCFYVMKHLDLKFKCVEGDCGIKNY